MTPMKTSLMTAIAVAVLAGFLAGPVAARAPDGTSPAPGCKSYIASQTKKARKLDTARKYARGNWEYQAWKKYGRKYDNWAHALHKQYGCSKKGKHHYCIAEAYPCSGFSEVEG
jgi:hypothetical protein